jgi:hypothetical protein
MNTFYEMEVVFFPFLCKRGCSYTRKKINSNTEKLHPPYRECSQRRGAEQGSSNQCFQTFINVLVYLFKKTKYLSTPSKIIYGW